MPKEQIITILSLGIYSFVWLFYVVSILQKKIRPHILSWLLWGILQAVIAVVQFINQAGYAAWITGSVSTSCFIIVLLSFFYHGERNITRSDKLFFGFALLIIPVWALTDASLLAAILVTIIDGLGYGPTFRKCFSAPFEEDVPIWFGSGVVNLLTLFAIETFSYSSAIYPAVSAVLNISGTLYILVRRYQITHPKS
jgi:hypothetical protein